jgi:GPI mannosyltransferase 3
MSSGGLLAIVTLVAIGLRVALVLNNDGLIYPDEVFQSLEQAHRIAFGSGFIPWEWQVGARHQLFVWLLAGIMKIGSHLVAPQLAARLFLATCSGLTTWFVAKLTCAIGASKTAGMWAATLWALCSISILLGGRGLSESAVTLPLVSGLFLVLRPASLNWHFMLGGLLLSVTVMFRLQMALVPMVLLVGFAMAHKWTELRVMLVTFTLGAFVFGFIDFLTWGDWFHSAVEYIRFNFIENGAQQFGTEGRAYYFVHGFKSGGGHFVFGLLAFLLVAKRAPVLAATVFFFFLVHVITPHKELRFLFPLVPIICALTGYATDFVSAKLAPLVVLLAVLTQPLPWNISLRMLGLPLEPGSAVAFDAGGEVSRLLAAAGATQGVCGVKIEGAQLGYTGAFAWFHAAHPLYDARREAPAGSFNLVISPRATAPVGTLLHSDGEFVLTHVAPDCAAVKFDWSLP